MRPILFEVFGFPIRAYGTFIALAILVATYVAIRLARRQGYQWAEDLENLVAGIVLAGVAGGRLWDVAFSLEKYRDNWWGIFAIWHGGLSIQGAIVGGLIAAVVFARRHRIPTWNLLDVLAPAVVLAQGIGRLTACVFNGDAFGRPTGTSFGIVYPPGSFAYDVYGSQPLWPAEVFEGLWDLAIFGILLALGRRSPRPGTITLLYAFLYSVGRFGLEFLRGDSLTVAGLKAAQVSSLIIAAVAIAWLIRRRPQGTAT